MSTKSRVKAGNNPFAAWMENNPFARRRWQGRRTTFAGGGKAGANPFAGGPDAMQTMMSGNPRAAAVGRIGDAVLAGALPAAPEAGWWWLPAVRPGSIFSRGDETVFTADRRRCTGSGGPPLPWRRLAVAAVLSGRARPVFAHLRRSGATWSNMPTLTTVSGIARSSSSNSSLDATAPSNFFLTNPEAIQRAVETRAKASARHGKPRARHRRPATLR